MPRPRPPWWMYVIAASVAGYLALNLYADAFGPGAIGAELRFGADGGPEILTIETGYPAEHAGLHPGDRIVLAWGQPVRTLFDWLAVSGQMAVAQPFPLVVEREGQRRQVALALRPHWHFWGAATWLLFLVKAGASILVLALGILLGVARWDDPIARLGAGFLTSLAVTNFVPLARLDPHAPTLPYGAEAIWRSLPAVLGAPLWIGETIFLLGPLLLVLFFLVFPRPALARRRSWLAVAASFLVVTLPAVAALLYWSLRDVYTPEHITGVFPDWFTPFVGAAVLFGITFGLASLVVNYRRLDDRSERRRVRVLVSGAVAGLAGSGVVAMSAFLGAVPGVQALAQSPIVRIVSALLFLVFPLSFAYAIARHRLFDVRILVRRGLQYALARRLLLSLVPVCAVLLAIDLLVHGDQPLRSIVAARGWIYGLVALLALAAHARRTRWLEGLDRRFFREHYDAQRLLRQIVDDLRSETTLERAGPHVVSQIEGALHPEFAALLVRAPGDTLYRPVAAAPPDRMPPPIPASSKLVTLVRVLAKPVDVAAGESGWMKEQLPHEETAFVRDTRIGLLVPVATADGGQDALLALGVKRSEEPYSREDQELMATLASSLALVVARPAAATPPREAFLECPRCGTCHDIGARSCPDDGASLLTVHFPRLLGQRYRIERRLGHGGMGTVYEGIDTQLDRRVALKVIREEWVGDGEAAERFRREARAAASFSHPNVVTVHDFGLAGEHRAFLVMELLRGATLRDVLRREHRLSPERCIALMRDLCAGVEAAHRRNLVHRDLKPENVFLVSDGESQRAKILDFGIAKVLAGGGQTATATGTGGVLGTLHYMGPEQLRGMAVDPTWDVWALAVMAYEMLAGSLPFDRTSAVDYQSAVVAGRLTPIRTHLPAAPEALEQFFARSLGTIQGERPARAPALLAELERALAVMSSASAGSS